MAEFMENFMYVQARTDEKGRHRMFIPIPGSAPNKAGRPTDYAIVEVDSIPGGMVLRDRIYVWPNSDK